MIPDELKDVEIVEPPIEELTKKNRWVGKACLSGCGFLLLFIIASVVSVKLFIGPGPKEAKNLPNNFPRDIPIYDEYNVEKITVISARYKSRSVEFAALFPKVILSPLIMSLGGNSNPEMSTATEETSMAKEIWRIITQPITDMTDTVEVEWSNIQSEPKSMMSYYTTKLADANFNLDTESEGTGFQQLTFSRSDGFSGSVYIGFTPQNLKQIDYAFLIVNIPLEIITSTTSTAN